MEDTTIRLAVWASGSGSNADNLATWFAEHGGAAVRLIVTNRPDAGVLDRARRLGIATAVFSNGDFKTGEAVLAAHQAAGIDWIVLGGFLRKVPPTIIAAYRGRILNIHPALLPRHGGKGMWGHHVHQAVVAAGDTESGITIHQVNEQYDEGQIVFQARCPVTPEDTPQTVEAKVRALEQAHYPKVVAEQVRK